MEPGPGLLHVAIIGAGGVGGLVGALLSREGSDVTFVATDATSEVLARQGISIQSKRYGDFTVAAAVVTMLTKPVDVCVVAVKATQLEAAIDRVPADRLGGALLVPFLNGIDHVGILRARYGTRVVPATMRVASTQVAPGVIAHSSPFMKVELAVPNNDSETRKELVTDFGRHLRAAGLEVDIVNDELSMLWGKLIFLGPLALLTTHYGSSAGDVRTAHRDELLAVIQEIAEIAGKIGAVLSAEAAVQFFDSVPPAMQSSMQHDAAAGKPIEIDAIGGGILRAAASVGVVAPVTQRLVAQLRQIAGA